MAEQASPSASEQTNQFQAQAPAAGSTIMSASSLVASDDAQVLTTGQFHQAAQDQDAFMAELFDFGKYEQETDVPADHTSSNALATTAINSANGEDDGDVNWLDTWNLAAEEFDAEKADNNIPQTTNSLPALPHPHDPEHVTDSKSMEPTNADLDPRTTQEANLHHALPAGPPEPRLWITEDVSGSADADVTSLAAEDDDEGFDDITINRIAALIDRLSDPDPVPLVQPPTRDEEDALHEADMHQCGLERQQWGLPGEFELPILPALPPPNENINPYHLENSINPQIVNEQDAMDRGAFIGEGVSLAQSVDRKEWKELSIMISEGMKNLANGLCRVSAKKGRDSAENCFQGLISGKLQATFPPGLYSIKKVVYTSTPPWGDVPGHVHSAADPLDTGKAPNELSKFKQNRAKWAPEWDDEEKRWKTSPPDEVLEQFRQAEAILTIAEDSQSKRESVTALLHTVRAALTGDNDHPLWIPRHRFMSSLALSDRMAHPINYPYINDVYHDVSAVLRHEAVAWHRLYQDFTNSCTMVREKLELLQKVQRLRATATQTQQRQAALRANKREATLMRNGIITSSQMAGVVSRRGSSDSQGQTQDAISRAPSNHASSVQGNSSLHTVTTQHQPWKYQKLFDDDMMAHRTVHDWTNRYLRTLLSKRQAGRNLDPNEKTRLRKHAALEAEKAFFENSFQDMLKTATRGSAIPPPQTVQDFRERYKAQFGAQRRRLREYQELHTGAIARGIVPSDRLKRQCFEEALRHTKMLEDSHAAFEKLRGERYEALKQQAATGGAITEDQEQRLHQQATEWANHRVQTEKHFMNTYQKLRDNFAQSGQGLTPQIDNVLKQRAMQQVQTDIERNKIRENVLKSWQNQGKQFTARELEIAIESNQLRIHQQKAVFASLQKHAQDSGQVLTPELQEECRQRALLKGHQIKILTTLRLQAEDKNRARFLKDNGREPTAAESQSIKQEAEAQAKLAYMRAYPNGIHNTQIPGSPSAAAFNVPQSLQSVNGRPSTGVMSPAAIMSPSGLNQFGVTSPVQAQSQMQPIHPPQFSPTSRAQTPYGHNQNAGSPPFGSPLEHTNTTSLDGNNSPNTAPPRARKTEPAAQRKKSISKTAAPPSVPAIQPKKKTSPNSKVPPAKSGAKRLPVPTSTIDLITPSPEPEIQPAQVAQAAPPQTPGRGKTLPQTTTKKAPVENAGGQRNGYGAIPYKIGPGSSVAPNKPGPDTLTAYMTSLQNSLPLSSVNMSSSVPGGHAPSHSAVPATSGVSRAPTALMTARSDPWQQQFNDTVHPSIETVPCKPNQPPAGPSGHGQHSAATGSTAELAGIPTQTAGLQQPNRQNYPVPTSASLMTPGGTHSNIPTSREFINEVNRHDVGFHLPGNPPAKNNKQQQQHQEQEQQDPATPSAGVKRKADAAPADAHAPDDKRQKTQAQARAPSQTPGQPQEPIDLEQIQHNEVRRAYNAPIATWDRGKKVADSESMPPPALPASVMNNNSHTAIAPDYHTQPPAPGDEVMIMDPVSHREDHFATAIDPNSDLGFLPDVQGTRFDGARGTAFDQVGDEYGAMYAAANRNRQRILLEDPSAVQQALEEKAFNPKTLAILRQHRANSEDAGYSWGWSHELQGEVMVRIPGGGYPEKMGW